MTIRGYRCCVSPKHARYQQGAPAKPAVGQGRDPLVCPYIVQRHLGLSQLSSVLAVVDQSRGIALCGSCSRSCSSVVEWASNCSTAAGHCISFGKRLCFVWLLTADHGSMYPRMPLQTRQLLQRAGERGTVLFLFWVKLVFRRAPTMGLSFCCLSLGRRTCLAPD